MSLPAKLLAVQQTIEKATKSGSNTHFKSYYADLNEVLDVSKTALNAVGICIAQAPGKDAFGQYVETSLIDSETGQQVSGKVYFSGAEDNMQKIGAAITYARRFGLKSLLAMEDADDDGETAVGRGNAHPKPAVSGPKGNDGGGKASVPAKAPAPEPVQTTLPKGPSRKTTNEKIRLTAKVLKDSKRMTQDEADKLLAGYSSTAVDELTDVEAADLLGKLETKLNK